MLEGSLLQSHYLGRDGFVWWIGKIAPAKVWRNEKSRLDAGTYEPGEGEDSTGGSWAYRCKVRIIGYHTFVQDELPDEDLPWAHVMASNEAGSFQGGSGQTHKLSGGETAFGFFLDGDDAQQPVVVGVLHRNASVKNVPDEDAKDRFRPTTGHKGNLSQSPTQIRKRNKGQQQPATTSTTPATGVAQKPPVLPKNKNAKRKESPPGADQAVREDLASQQFAAEAAVKIVRENGCSDNLIGKISQELNNFIQFISRIEDFIGTYIDPVLNTFVDIVQEIKGFASRIVGIIKFIINNMRGAIIQLVTSLFRDFIAKILPMPQHPPVAEATKNIINIIFCLFEKLIPLLIDYIVNLLTNMIGKAINAPMCAVEEWTAGILSKLMDFIEDLLGPVMSGLDWLLGGIGQISSVLGQVSSLAQQILNFIGCDQLKCEASTTWDSKSKAAKAQRDSWNRTLGNMNVLKGVNDDLDEAMGAISLYGNTGTSPFRDCARRTANPTKQSDQSPMPPGMIAPNCIPPEIEVFGDGVLGQVLPIVGKDGGILTVKVINPGKGYSKPPSINIIDNTNHGNGARFQASIEDGRISNVYVLNPGSGYCPGNYSSIVSDPSYVVFADKYSVFEGDSVTFTIQTENVPDGNKVEWYFSGDVSIDDFDSPTELSGELEIKNGEATLIAKIRQDSVTEPVETLFFDLYDSGGDYVARTRVFLNNRLSPVLTPEPDEPVESPPGTPVPKTPDGGTSPGIGTGGGIIPGIGTGGTGGTGTGGGDPGIGTNFVGIITNIIVDRPGFGYSTGDSVEFGGCVYNLKVTETGSIVGVESASSCKNAYEENPGEGVITTTNGQAGRLFAVLEFTPLTNKVTVVDEFGVISVVDCV